MAWAGFCLRPNTPPPLAVTRVISDPLHGHLPMVVLHACLSANARPTPPGLWGAHEAHFPSRQAAQAAGIYPFFTHYLCVIPSLRHFPRLPHLPQPSWLMRPFMPSACMSAPRFAP